MLHVPFFPLIEVVILARRKSAKIFIEFEGRGRASCTGPNSKGRREPKGTRGEIRKAARHCVFFPSLENKIKVRERAPLYFKGTE